MFRLLSIIGATLFAFQVQATTFTLPSPETRIIGHNMILVSRHEDTLLDIARTFDLGYHDIVSANPDVDPWLPGEGQRIVIPKRYILPDAPRQGIVVNLAELRLYYYPKPASGEAQRVVTFPIGIGREGWRTPLGRMSIIQKRENPTWTPPASIRAAYLEEGKVLPDVVPPGPDNPLGAHAIRLSNPSYLIHGTHRPYGVGMRVSSGCIRLFPEDIEQLYHKVSLGTQVEIIYQPHKAAIHNGQLYLEAHKPLDDIDDRHTNNLTPMVQSIIKVQDDSLRDEDWPFVEKVVREHRGLVKGLHQDALPIVEDIWFLHAGMKKGSTAKFRAILDKLDLGYMFWPINNRAHEEMVLGPFESEAEAIQVAEKITAAGVRVWPVMLSEDAL
ncbi:L,D-transpeptidase family protein [Methylophaga lonarensis]|uniref:L,D-transpeptidase family protein n=1 Tax=Methylophaga lonarensis TaxID=999151 RepID=UPI003D2DE1D4